jgi:hypothetical protein
MAASARNEPVSTIHQPLSGGIAVPALSGQYGAMFDWTNLVADLIPDGLLVALCAAVLLLLAVLILWVELG